MKSKVKFESFDLKNEKVKNPDQAQQKNLSKAAIKKLANQEGIATSFHLIFNYFKDEAGKALGHFLDVGENKKLTKHFEQVEMKSGKLDKSMSASQKEAATGQIYVKKVNGQPLVHVEPAPSCKVPGGKWGKLLKELKAQFGGMKAVVVFEGKPITSEEELEEENAPIEETTLPQNQAKIQKMQEGVAQMSQMVGKAPKAKLEANIAKYETAITTLEQETLSNQEQTALDELKASMETLRIKIEEQGATLTPEIRQKMRENMDKMMAQLNKTIAQMTNL